MTSDRNVNRLILFLAVIAITTQAESIPHYVTALSFAVALAILEIGDSTNNEH